MYKVAIGNRRIALGLSDPFYRGARRVALAIGFKSRSYPLRGSVDMIPADEKRSTAMHRAFYENEGAVVNKWRHYPSIYDRHLSSFRNKKAKILEIGVSGGGSLQIWREYFGQDATIFGIDINPACAAFDGAAGSVRIGSQADPSFLRSVAAEMEGIDIVIDDGSHVASHQRASFETLFPMMSDNGVYICEDTHTAYWRGEFEGGYRRPSNFIEYSKRIIDDIHADFHDKPVQLEGASRTIFGIHFYNSVVVVEKLAQSPPMQIAVPS
jgi:hypothetical protein